MTSVELDPVVSQKLARFKLRRTRLLIARGVSVGLLSFVFAFSLVAAIDWYWLLTDSVRWTLTICSYVFVAVSVWFSCISRVIQRPSDEAAAKLIEETEPELRENLLSAVELAVDDPDAINDSPVFRGLLQGQVAEQMGSVQISRLLPTRLIAAWLVAAFVFAGVAAALLLIGDSRIRQLAARALMPGANIARISRVQVKVISPSPSSLMMAAEETVAVVVEVTGGNVDDVILETFSPKQGTIRQSMNGRSAIEFAANIHLKDEPVEYRIFAGDAITQRFTIDTRMRPHVTGFEKTFHYPEYAKLDSKTEQANHGDLIVLEGTTANLTLKVDQPISSAELRINPLGTDEIRTVPLIVESGQVRGTVKVEENSYYKVHLVAEETGFENVFAPKYEIRPKPDLIPKAGFVNQRESTLLLPPNDIVSLQGMAEDDLPLVGFEQQIAINSGEWTTLSLDLQPVLSDEGRKMESSWKWDLVDHRFQPGDEVLTRLVARDRKGNTGESIPLRIIIADQQFDPDRHSTLLTKLRFLSDVSSYSKSIGELKDSALKIADLFADKNRSVVDRRSDLSDLNEILAKQSEQTSGLLAKSHELMKILKPGVDSNDMELTARVIERIQNEHVINARLRGAKLTVEDPKKTLNARVTELKHTLNRTADDARSLFHHYQSFVTHSFVVAVASDLSSIHRQQKQIVERQMDTFARLKRQQAVSTGKLEELGQLIEAHQESLPSNIRNQVTVLKTWIDKELETIRTASESEEKFGQLKSSSKNLEKQLGYKQRFDSIDGGLPQRIISARRDFSNRSGSLFVSIYDSGTNAREIHRLRNSSDMNVEVEKQLQQLTWEILRRPGLNRLKARRDITQLRPDADSQFAADLGLTHRAVNHLADVHLENTKESRAHEHLLEVATAYRTLEAGHAFKKVELELNLLLSMERWDSRKESFAHSNPHQWESITTGLELASSELRNARIDQKILSQVDQLRWSKETNAANQKITQRRWKRDQMVSAVPELEILRERILTLERELKPEMDAARAIIQKYAPTLSDLARKAAEKVKELQEKTTQTADKSEQSDPETKESIEDLEASQEEVNQQLDDLVDALVEEANKQDLLDDEQRERARDADSSIEMVKQPAEEMNQALEKASETPEGKQQAQELSKAAEQQEKTAQALEKIADHFEKLDRGEDVTESRNELRQSEQQTANESPLADDFEQADQLAEMAKQNPSDLMKELEAELQKNPAMREALSEIAKNTLEKAENDLKKAAQEENNLQRANEQSDQSAKKPKEDLAKELSDIGKETAKLVREEVQQANQAAAQAKSPEAQKQLSETQQQLNQVARKAGQANPNQMMKELQETANDIKKAIDKANEELEKAKKGFEKAKQNDIFSKNENHRKSIQKAWENNRKLFRDNQRRAAQNDVRNAENQKRNADRQVQNAERLLQQTRNRLNRAKQQLKQKPDDQNRKNQVRNEENRQRNDEKRVADAKAKQAEEAKKVEQAKKEAATAGKKPDAKLDAPNPASQLAEQYAKESQEKAKKLQERINKLAEKAQQSSEFKPTKEQLKRSSEQQKNVTEDVKQTAEDLRRSARHEKRLDNENASKAIEEVARQVQETADDEVTDAEKSLDKAAAEPEKSDSDQPAKQNQNQPAKGKQAEAKSKQAKGQPEKSDSQTPSKSKGDANEKGNQPKQPSDAKGGKPEPSKGQSNSEKEQSDSPNNASKAQQDLETAEQALRDQADSLAQKSEELQNAAAESQQGQPQQGQPQQGQPQQGQPQQGQPQQGQPQQGQPQQGQPQQGQPQQGQPQQGQPQQGQSQQGQSQQGQPQQGQQSVAEIAKGRQLAQALDELDRQMSQASQQGQPSQSGQPAQGQPQTPSSQQQGNMPLDSLAQAAQAQQSSMASQRSRAQQQSQLSQANQQANQQASEPSFPSDSLSDPALTGAPKSFQVRKIDRDGKDWGKLRGKSAEGTTTGQKDKVSEEYRKKVEAYFKVLAEQARAKK